MSEDTRIPTHVWLMAELRRLEAMGAAYYILQKGEIQSGTVVVKIMTPAKTCGLYQQNRDENGVLGWLRIIPKGHTGETVEEVWADAYIARAKDRDPDLWVVDIETRTDDFPLEGPVFNESE